MSTDVYLSDSLVRISHRSTQPVDNSIYPRINVGFEVSNIARPGTPAVNFNILSVVLKLHILKQGLIYRVGELVPDQTFFSLPSGSSFHMSCDWSLDHYGLKQVEKLRENNDLAFRVAGLFVAENQQQPLQKAFSGFSLDFRIPKSDWVEDMLPRLKYKDIILIEVPKVREPQFEDIMVYVNGAWRQYSMGEYDKVLTECRKALEKLTDKIKSEGFEKEAPSEPGAKKVPDWDKLMCNSELGDVTGKINQSLWRFLAPSAHAGKAINREDADFALMITHAIVSLVVNKLS